MPERPQFLAYDLAAAIVCARMMRRIEIGQDKYFHGNISRRDFIRLCIH